MKKLSNRAFQTTENFIKINGRGLEKSLFDYFFVDGGKTGVIQELKKYQNEDGGFGKGLEPDFRMPFSSALATSIGLRIISEIEGKEEGSELIKGAVNYLENTFDSQRVGWFAVSSRVNDFDHTPWWVWDKERGMTIIDWYWGNPSAEIIAYLVRYRGFVEGLDILNLVEIALKNIEGRINFESEHELYCYLKLYVELEGENRKRLEKKLKEGIGRLVEYNREKWSDYVPLPLHFVRASEDNRFGIREEKIEENLDFFLEILETQGYLSPPWGDSFYTGEFKVAINEWKGILTLEALKTLANFNRLSI